MLASRQVVVGSVTRFVIEYDTWLDSKRGERLSSFSPVIGPTGTFAAGPATISNIATEPNLKAGEFLVGGPFSANDSWQVSVTAVTSLGQSRTDLMQFNAVPLS